MGNLTLSEDELARLNGVELHRLIPLLVYLGIIATAGIPGNITICLAYRVASQKSSTRFFIWLLAVVDTISCFALFLEIVNVVHQFNYPSAGLCKLTIFTTIVPIVTSGLCLCLISIDRFQRVCRPLKAQITVSKARKMSVVVVIIALFFAWPSAILYGIHDIPIPGTNGTGRECTIQTHYQNATVTRVYQTVLWILFIGSLVFLSVMYTLIGRRIFSQMEAFSPNTSINNQSFQREMSLGSIDDTSSETTNHPRLTTQHSCSDSRRKLSAVSSFDIKRKSSTSGRSVARQNQARKSAFMMCIISVVFIVSFLPYLILRACEAFDKTFVTSMTDTQRALYKTFLRTYFLNCAVNPFIYCACAAAFRRDMREYFRHVFMRFH